MAENSDSGAFLFFPDRSPILQKTASSCTIFPHSFPAGKREALPTCTSALTGIYAKREGCFDCSLLVLQVSTHRGDRLLQSGQFVGDNVPDLVQINAHVMMDKHVA